MTLTRADFIVLEQMGWSGCALDNDCACSDASHERDQKLLKKYEKEKKKDKTKSLLRSAILNMERSAGVLETEARRLRSQIEIYKQELG